MQYVNVASLSNFLFLSKSKSIKSCTLPNERDIIANWLLGSNEDLRRFNDISAILQLGSRVSMKRQWESLKSYRRDRESNPDLRMPRA